MRKRENFIIVGVDHGYGNIKTASKIFPSGIFETNPEQIMGDKLLIYENKCYLIGQGHKEFVADKFLDNEYYILTLAAIAEELSTQGITNANIHIAAGVPLTWLGSQAKHFKEYLSQKQSVDFRYKIVITA